MSGTDQIAPEELESRWARVDDYIEDLFVRPDPALYRVLTASREAGLPQIQVAANQGKMLMLLARMARARRILEVGTLGGYSTTWLARALPEDGSLLTLEYEPRHAEVARRNLTDTGLGDRVEIKVGAASESLRELIGAGTPPFDFVFIDADKPGYPDYFEQSAQLCRPGSVIVADNVVRAGKVADAHNPDPLVQGVRRFAELVSADPRVSATMIQTVGNKGYDGFLLATVNG